MDTPERDEAVVVASTVLRRRRRSVAPLSGVSSAARRKDQSIADWQSVADLRVLRSADALREEFLTRKQEDDARRLGALLYAVMKFPHHQDAVEMLNCCAVNRFLSAQNNLHLVQALRGFDLALTLVKPREQKWKIAINRLGLLTFLGAPSVVLRNAGWLVTEVPTTHTLYAHLCYIMGTCYAMVNRLEMSVYALERAYQTCESDRAALREDILLAWVRRLARLGSDDKAQSLLAEAVNPTTAYYWAVQAEILYWKQDWLPFLSLAKRAIRIFTPQSPWSLDRHAVAELHFQMSAAYEQLEQRELSSQHFAIGQALGLALGGGEVKDRLFLPS